MSERLPWAVAAVLWAALIYWMSAQSASNIDVDWLDVPGLDKLAHGVTFGVLAALFAQALRGVGEIRSLVLAVILVSLYGVTDELHQRFVPGRQPDLLDWVADTVGAAIFVTGVWFLRR